MTSEQVGLDAFVFGLARHGASYRDDTGKVFLSLRERLPFIDRADWITHVCKGGERCVDLAIKYFKRFFAFPVDAAPIIAECQEFPVLNVTDLLEKGRVVLIPSPDYVNDYAYGSSLLDTPRII
jgi:hypothetical protein